MPPVVTPPPLFDQRAGVPQSRRRKGLVIGVLLAAAMAGGAAGLVLVRDSGDDITAPDDSAPDDSAPETTASTTALPTTVATTSPPTTAPDSAPTTVTTIAATTVPTTVPANPSGVPLGQPASVTSPLPEERFVAALGVSADQAAPGSPALVAATWWVLANQRAMPLTWVSSPRGFTHTNSLGGRVEYQNFEATEGKVSNATFCVLRPDGSDERCRQIAEVITVDAQRALVAQTPVISLSRWAKVTLPEGKTATLLTYTSTQPVTAMSSADVERIDFDGSTVVFTGAASVAVAVVQITYADGSQEAVPVNLACCS